MKIQIALDELTRIQDELTAAENRVEELRQKRDAKILATKKLGARNVQMARAMNKTEQLVYGILRKHKQSKKAG